MGLLDSLLGGARDQGRGGMSPLTLGLLALLAYQTYQGKGRLADMLGRNAPDGAAQPDGRVTGPGSLPDGSAAGPLGSGAGGLGDILGSLLGGGAGARPAGGAAGMPGGGLGDLLGGALGGLLGGGAAGSVLNGGLGDLMRRMQENGQGDAADSWIGRGPNRAIDPKALESALGRDTLEELAQQSGRPYMDVLSELSNSLPDTVDQLTPQGRMPTDDEAKQWV